MTDLASIDDQIAELKAARDAQVKAAAVAKQAAIAAVPVVWVWTVEWLNGHTADIRKRWSDETIAAMAAAGAEERFTDWTTPHGMKYTLTCDNHLVSFGGGHVILDIGHSFDKTGRLLTDAQIAMLRAGEVPTELMTHQW